MEILTLDVGAGATAFSTLRGGETYGGAEGAYGGFNVCHYTGDAPAHVADCRRELAAYMGTDVNRLVIPRQTHSVNVAVIGDRLPCLEDVDALVTTCDDFALVVNTADCLPVVFNDSRRGVIAIAHAGWRGLYDGILAATVMEMARLGAVPRDIRVAIGPCICGACYEVDEAFAKRFEARFGSGVRMPVASGHKPHVDLRAAAITELQRCGIDLTGISDSGVCSRCDGRLFSARRQGVRSGRIATVVKRVG